ncbi:Leucine Rich Repeat [Seminavis robusta]|uniref:Leucine Rich Repeat n=1 Tax=Seminavis robusta TaxID=568900 RepID=A0A9N8DDK4_9STRA|nr:Leucine Rich Repeat [Seminavis robusta]|eukprot:Sro24_g016630.1 Leucine Rich Repeat (776) ;mRNA; f:161673-164000
MIPPAAVATFDKPNDPAVMAFDRDHPQKIDADDRMKNTKTMLGDEEELTTTPKAAEAPQEQHQQPVLSFLISEAIETIKRLGFSLTPTQSDLVKTILSQSSSTTTTINAATNRNAKEPSRDQNVASEAAKSEKQIAVLKAPEPPSCKDEKESTEMQVANPRTVQDQFGNTLDSSIQPFPTATPATRGPHASQPGAFAVAGINSPRMEIEEDLSLVVTQDPEVGLPPSSSVPYLSLESSNPNPDLVQAQPVNEVNTESLQHAEDLSRRKATRADLRVMMSKFAACGLLLVLVIVVPVGLVARNKSGDSGLETKNVASPTDAPSLLPDSEVPVSLEDQVLSLLPPETITNIQTGGSSNQSLTPQAQAFQWIMQDPAIGIYSDERIIQRFALATLYHATNGPEWFQNNHWLNYTKHECEWFARDGSKVYWPSDPDPDFPCGARYSPEGETYEKLWLYENNLQGELPAVELALLTSLTSISINRNPQMEGTISSYLGKLSKLKMLDMSRLESLEGSMPSELALLTALTGLSLLYNGLEGSIPLELFSVSTLKHLFVDNNELTGTLASEIGKLSLLENPYLHSNLLSGTLPTELGLLSFVDHLSLDKNLFHGPLPSELGQLSAVEHFVLMHNAITGTVPTELGLLNRPRLDERGPTYYMNLGHNLLEGPLPSELGQLSLTKHLWLNNNSFTGQLPEEIERMVTSGSLLSLNLTLNPLLSGTIPQALCSVGPGPNVSCPIDNKWYQACGLSFDCDQHQSGSLCGCNCPCIQTAKNNGSGGP